MSVAEAPKNTQEKYLQLHFISSIKSERIPVFEEYLCRSNAVVIMSEKLPHTDLPIGEGPILSNMFVLADTGAGLN